MATVAVKKWGVAPSGEDILQYILRNGAGTEVRLTNVGASICGVRFADKCGLFDEVLLGYAKGEDYIGDTATCGKTVGRVANRIKRGHLEVEGKVYQLEINNQLNHLSQNDHIFLANIKFVRNVLTEKKSTPNVC